MKPLMLITAPVATRSGYGSHSRDLVRGLISMDKFDIHINSMKWGNCPMNALDDKNPNDSSRKWAATEVKRCVAEYIETVGHLVQVIDVGATQLGFESLR